MDIQKDTSSQRSGERIMENLFAETVETARALARTCDPQTSKDAALKMVKSGALNRQEQWVLRQIENSMFPDFTALEIARGIKDKYYYIIQRRLSGLNDKGKIELTGERRDGCRVWRLVNRKYGN